MNLARRALLVLIVGALLALGAPPASLAQENGTIAGHVANGTAGASSPADVEVIVHILQNRVKTGERRVRTDAAGDFLVDGLATGQDFLYFPIVEYGGVPYYPDRPAMLQSSAPVPVQITVYEVTPRPESLSFERLNMLVMSASPTALTIMEMGAVVNASGRTFAANAQVTGSARTVRFVLPSGAIEVTPQAGLPADTLESTPDGFATTDPVRPGRREIAFSYQLPYSSSDLDLARAFTLPVGTFTLYVPNDIGAVMPGGIANSSLADLGGRQYRQYMVDGVAPGAEVRFRLTGLPAPFFARPRDLGLAVTGVAGAALLAFLMMAVRRRVARPATLPAASDQALDPESGQVSAERLALLRAVAELDERFAAGGVDDTTYAASRAEKKARLVALTRTSAIVS